MTPITHPVTVTQSEIDHYLWVCDCGREFIIKEGAPTEAGFTYCPRCGGQIEDEPALTDEQLREINQELIADDARDRAGA